MICHLFIVQANARVQTAGRRGWKCGDASRERGAPTGLSGTTCSASVSAALEICLSIRAASSGFLVWDES